MRNHLRSTVAALGIGLMTAGVFAPAAFSLTNPATFAPRQFPSQQTHYIRMSISWDMCTPVTNTCVVKIPAALPYNSAVIRVTSVVGTAFNSTTSDVIFIGNQLGPPTNQIVAAGCTIHAIAITACIVDTGAINATGNNATQTGLNGGFDLFLRWTSVGTVATAGNGAIVIEYVAPNDGDCVAVPMGGTAVGC